MQANSSSSGDCDMNKELEELVDVFGSEYSLEDIRFAYLQSRQDKNLAAETLCSLHGSTSSTMVAAENAVPMQLTSVFDSNARVVSADGDEKTKELLKSKKCSAVSVGAGSVSCVIGKEYAKTTPLKNESIEVKKPLKLDSKDFPVSELWSEPNPSSITTMRNVSAEADVDEFLFKMLGEGFQLDMPVIQEVLGCCGYDMQKSIDKLLDSSVAPFGSSDHGIAVEDSAGKCSDQGGVLLQGKMQQLDFAQSDRAGLMEKNLTGSTERKKDRLGLQKEVLQALFDFPDRTEEAPKRTRVVRAVKKPKAFSKLVLEPFTVATREDKPSAAESQAITGEEEDDNDSYEVLRTAVKEYWVTMKEYYKAAVDAFVQGDYPRANKLLEQGHFFNNKAREADDKSCQKLIETRDAEVMSLKLHGLEPKEALSLLRLHLTSISGISSIKYLRVIMESNDEDTKQRARKRKLILKQLEKESIKWNDETDGNAILIQVDVIDPKRLSFVKKQELVFLDV